MPQEQILDSPAAREDDNQKLILDSLATLGREDDRRNLWSRSGDDRFLATLRMTNLSDWVGRRESQTDWITPSHVAAWRATLDEQVTASEEVPPAFYWALFPPRTPTSRLSDDGHARRGDFLPPVALPRRMWAGSRLTYHAQLRVGAQLERESVIHSVESKQGRAGELVFVTVRHTVREGGADVLIEEQDLVYRSLDGSTDRRIDGSTRAASWQRTILPNEALLFRYSALTFNAHRIHYDRPYAQSEGYPGLVVHGPLIATLLLGLVHSNMPDVTVERFEFKARRPAFDGAPLTLCGMPSRHAPVSGHPAESPWTINLWSLTADSSTGVESKAWIR